MAEPEKRVKIPGARRFIIYTMPTVSDPAWTTPVIEIEDSDVEGGKSKQIPYYDTSVLENIVNQIQRDTARAAGYHAGAEHVLKIFGLTRKQYFEKMAETKADKAKEKQDGVS